MKKLILIFTFLLGLISGCISHSGKGGESESTDSYSFVILDEEHLSGERTIKLSELVEGYEVVKFENSDSAFFKTRKPVVSEHYIAVIQGGTNPIILFDRQGKFIGKIGDVGQGPGEYMMAYDAIIDEVNDRVYVVEMTKNQVLEYNLKGDFQISRIIGTLNKPTLFHNEDGSVSIVNMAFSDWGDILTAATYLGNNDSISTLTYQPLVTSLRDATGDVVGFNNEAWAFKNTPNNIFMLTFNDTLYAYNHLDNIILPRAFLKEKSGKNPASWYVGLELPTAIIYQVVGPDSRTIWYEKSSGELSHANLVNDYCGNAIISVGDFRDGYYVKIWEPGLLMDQIEDRWLKENDMNEQQRDNLKRLLSELNPDDNNIMFIGRLTK